MVCGVSMDDAAERIASANRVIGVDRSCSRFWTSDGLCDVCSVSGSKMKVVLARTTHEVSSKATFLQILLGIPTGLTAASFQFSGGLLIETPAVLSSSRGIS